MKQSFTLIYHCAVFALAGSALGFAGAAQGATETAKKSETTTTDTANRAKPAGSEKLGSSLSMKDKSFIKDAAKGGMMEVEMGHTAQQQGKSAEVKQIGGRLVADHTKANNELMAIAKKKGYTLPNEKAKMEKIDSANFDKQYLNMMVKDHEKDLAAFEAEAKNGSDTDLKGFANSTSKVIKQHLDLVKAAQGKIK